METEFRDNQILFSKKKDFLFKIWGQGLIAGNENDMANIL